MASPRCTKPAHKRVGNAVLVALSPEQRRRVEAAAHARGLSYGALGRLALDHFLQNETPPGKGRRVAQQEARDASARTSKIR